MGKGSGDRRRDSGMHTLGDALTKRSRENLERVRVRTSLPPAEKRVADANPFLGELLINQGPTSEIKKFRPSEMRGEENKLVTYITALENGKRLTLRVTFTLTGPHTKKENFRIEKVIGYPHGEHHRVENPDFSINFNDLVESAKTIMVNKIHDNANRADFMLSATKFPAGILQK
ncbi:MAG: hypothetical protein NUV57_04415 [archaeon]|nr:hypothetical protein [archaeon]